MFFFLKGMAKGSSHVVDLGRPSGGLADLRPAAGLSAGVQRAASGAAGGGPWG